MSSPSEAILPGRQGVLRRLADTLWRHPRLLLLLMLAPPVLWLGVIYLGSLAALLVQSFFSIDEFSGLINYEFTLKTYRELLIPANLDILVRTVSMAAVVTLAAVVVAFPIAFYAARYARGATRPTRSPIGSGMPRSPACVNPRPVSQRFPCSKSCRAAQPTCLSLT